MNDYNRGRLDVLAAIKRIYDNSKYPEYLEEDIGEYLDKEYKNLQGLYVDTDLVKEDQK